MIVSRKFLASIIAQRDREIDRVEARDKMIRELTIRNSNLASCLATALDYNAEGEEMEGLTLRMCQTALDRHHRAIEA